MCTIQNISKALLFSQLYTISGSTNMQIRNVSSYDIHHHLSLRGDTGLYSHFDRLQSAQAKETAIFM